MGSRSVISTPKTTIWLASRMRNTRARPMRSATMPHNSLPPPLNIELTAMSMAP